MHRSRTRARADRARATLLARGNVLSARALTGRRERDQAYCARPTCSRPLEFLILRDGRVAELCADCGTVRVLRRREAVPVVPDVGRGILRVPGVIR